MNTMLTLGAAARHCGVSKGTISKAIASGKLSATRREDGSWAIDGAELARYLEVNGHRFRSETGSGEQVETTAELRARADLAEQRLADLKEALADMRWQRDAMAEQRDKWETVAQRLALPAPKPPAETPETAPEGSRLRRAWRWMRATG
jgi:Helix-turn-helix domain